MNILLIEPGKPPRPTEIPQTLSAMQHLVGGYIQVLYPFDDPVALVCNEEGKLKGLPLNRALRDEAGTIYDIISGPFFLCGAPLDSEDFADLTDEQLKRYYDQFRLVELYFKAQTCRTHRQHRPDTPTTQGRPIDTALWDGLILIRRKKRT